MNGALACNANARPVTSKLTSGSTVYALTQTGYDGLGRVECVAQRMDPNDFGSTLPNACTLTSPAGTFGPDRIVKTIYDAAGQATQVKTALGVTGEEANVVTGTYTNNGLVQTMMDAESNKTTYVYDGHDRLSQTQFPSTTKGAGTSSTTDYEQLAYENRASGTRTSGTVTSFRNRANETIAFAYDALGRLTTKDLPGTEPDVTFGYDLLGRMISASKTNENMTFSYDALGRLTSQTNPAGTVGATWDLAGRRTRLTWPDTKYVDYDYLVTGEMEKVRFNGATSGANVLATYGYDNLGRRASLTRGNGTSTSYAYDAVSRLDTLSHDPSGTTQDVSYTYGYNPASQIVSVTRSNDLYAWTKHGSGTTSTTSNGLNQIASWNATVTHDAKGNITSDGTNSFSYSSENLMTGATVPPWGSDTFGYDPLMRLRGSGSASQQRFLRFQDDMLAEYYGTTLVERFVPGAGEDETTATLNRFDTRSWYYGDERGSTVGKAGDPGTATIYAYDEYGRPGTTTPPRMGYTGQMLFITDQVYDYKNRMYHPGLGRFLQPDPIGYAGGMNLYAYVGGDSVNGVDPQGLVCMRENWSMHIYNKQGQDLGPDPKDPESWTTYVGCDLTQTPQLRYGGYDLGGGGSGGDGQLIVVTARKPAGCVGHKYASFFASQAFGASFVAMDLGVDPTLLLGLAAHESGWGTSPGTARNNPFGATPHGDRTRGLSYPSMIDAWASWSADWGARMQRVGANANAFVGNLLQDNRNAIGAVDRRGSYNSEDPLWRSKVLGAIGSVRSRWGDWLAHGC